MKNKDLIAELQSYPDNSVVQVISIFREEPMEGDFVHAVTDNRKRKYKDLPRAIIIETTYFKEI